METAAMERPQYLSDLSESELNELIVTTEEESDLNTAGLRELAKRVRKPDGPGIWTNHSRVTDEQDLRANEDDESTNSEGLPFLPQAAYDKLPQLLTQAAALFQQRQERDVFLTSALGTLSGALPNVISHNRDGALAPNLYFVVTAPAGAGKGPLEKGKLLVEEIDDQLKDQSERAREDWESRRAHAEEKGEVFDDPEPPLKRLLFKADVSARRLFDALKAADERGIIFATEADRLSDTLQQDWGKIDSVLRAAYHHESDGYMRKEEDLHLDSPEISCVLSGTLDQIRRLFGSAENGLYSRFGIYYFQGDPSWKSQRPTGRSRNRDQHLRSLGADIYELYQVLSARSDPLRIELETNHWEDHDSVFGNLKYHLHEHCLGQLSSIVHRAGVIALRLATIFTVLRSAKHDCNLGEADFLTAEDLDVEMALLLARTYAEHSIHFAATKFDNTTSTDAQSVRIGTILQNVPDTFSNQDVYDISDPKLEVSEGQLRDDLREAGRRGIIQKLKRSHWKKSKQTG